MKKKKETQHQILPISLFVKFTLVYFVILIIFAYLFLQSLGLCITVDNTTANSFFDYLYFSFITFHTIGYGDIIPNNDEAKKLIMILSFLSLMYTTFFAGFIIDAFIKRREEIKNQPFQDIAYESLYDLLYMFSHPFIPIEHIFPAVKCVYFGNYYSVEKPIMNKDLVNSNLGKKIRENLDFITNENEKNDELKKSSSIEYNSKIESISIFNAKLDAFIVSHGKYISHDILIDIRKLQIEITDLFKLNQEINIIEFKKSHHTIAGIILCSLKIREKLLKFSIS